MTGSKKKLRHEDNRPPCSATYYIMPLEANILAMVNLAFFLGSISIIFVEKVARQDKLVIVQVCVGTKRELVDCRVKYKRLVQKKSQCFSLSVVYCVGG